MKLQNLQQVKQAKVFPPVYLILCKDEGEQKFYFQSLLDALISFLKIGKQTVSIKIFSGEAFSLSAFKQEVETQPFLTPYVFIHVTQAEKLKQDEIKELSHFIKAPSPWAFCFFSSGQLSAKNNLYQTIDAQGWVFQKSEEKAWEKDKDLSAWIAEEALHLGKHIDQKTCQLLLKKVGHQRELLKSEILKLVCFIGERRDINIEDLRQITTDSHMETLWQLGEAIMQEDSARAVNIAQHLLEEGIAIYALIAHVRSQFQTSLNIFSIFLTEGYEAVTRSFPYLKGNFLEKKIQTLKHFGIDRLQQGVLSLHEVELMLRNYSVEPACILDMLIIRLIYGTRFTSFSKSPC